VDLGAALGVRRAVVLLTGWISQVMLAKGIPPRRARRAWRSPLVLGGCILAVLPHVTGAASQIALLVVGSGLCGSIYVVCPPMLGEFTPVSQRGAVIAIYGALYTLAGIIAPFTMGSVIKHAANAARGLHDRLHHQRRDLVASGVLGLLLLWPNTERARLTAAAAQPKFA
jgi:sugar phosphate permease